MHARASDDGRVAQDMPKIEQLSCSARVSRLGLMGMNAIFLVRARARPPAAVAASCMQNLGSRSVRRA
jgi:hypothetical protein